MNIIYGSEAKRFDRYGPQEMATQAHQAFHADTICLSIADPEGPAGQLSFEFSQLVDLSFRVRVLNQCCILV